MNWSLQDAKETYALPHWSDGYFDLAANGNIIALPSRDPAKGQVELLEIVRAAEREGLSLPLLVRFTDILNDRVRRLTRAFSEATAAYDYQGEYTPVYPIKVNQQRSVIEAIVNTDVPRIGLESGSKSELLAVLALAPQGTTVICNGYKDPEYIRLALIGKRLGLNLWIVIEKLSELGLVLEQSKTLDIAPMLGIRVRLASISAGKWQNSGGQKSKFGLTAADVCMVVHTLANQGNLDTLQLMHFHVGSQVANINDLKEALREAARYYGELRKLGVPLQMIDAGGGLGIDYEGSHSNSANSINYSLDEYAHSVVRVVAEVCAEANLPQPHILTESGRALTAHHAVLVTDVLEVEKPDKPIPPMTSETAPILEDLHHALDRLNLDGPLRAYHDAQFDLREAHLQYAQGQLTLLQLAEVEHLYTAICQNIRSRLKVHLRSHRQILDELNDRLADKVFCNFSLFQSMPDAWAIDQIFPVLPLQRLNEAPTRRGRIMDLTCDSDGSIERYVDHQSIESTLPLHEINENETYLIGFFLVGAYQEILGDMHNLFGDTHSVNVELDDLGGWRLTEARRGDYSSDLLRYVHLETDRLQQAYRKKLAEAGLPMAQRKLFESELVAGLNGYTYLED